jgi:hypothetical protein
MFFLALALACSEPPAVHETLPLAEDLATLGVERWPVRDLAPGWIPTLPARMWPGRTTTGPG